jgi:hypothetical protein
MKCNRPVMPPERCGQPVLCFGPLLKESVYLVAPFYTATGKAEENCSFEQITGYFSSPWIVLSFATMTLIIFSFKVFNSKLVDITPLYSTNRI